MEKATMLVDGTKGTKKLADLLLHFGRKKREDCEDLHQIDDSCKTIGTLFVVTKPGEITWLAFSTPTPVPLSLHGVQC